MMSPTFHPINLETSRLPVELAKLTLSAQPSDPATSVLTDLRQGPCISVDHDDGLDQTLMVMVKAGVHMAFVAGLHGDVIGMVTTDMLQGEGPVLRALDEHVRHEELTLADMMLPVAKWHVAQMAQVQHARVGDIVATLRESGQRYLLVTEPGAAGSVLRGVFSARRIELALNTVIDEDLHSRSFAELGTVLGR